MSRPGGKKRGLKSHANHSPRRELDHKCPRYPADYHQFRTPDFTEDLGDAQRHWFAYLREVQRLEPNPRRDR